MILGLDDAFPKLQIILVNYFIQNEQKIYKTIQIIFTKT